MVFLEALSKGYRWVSVCVLSLAAATFLPSKALASQDHREAAFGDGDTPGAASWEDLDRAQWAQVLGVLADQTQGNYERIRTWTGTYRVHVFQELSPRYVQDLLRLTQTPGTPSPMGQEADFLLRFAIDMQSESIFRSKEETKLRTFHEGSKESVKLTNGGAPPNESSVVTLEHWLHFDPKAVYPAFGTANFPEARNKRAAFREPHQDALRLGMADLIDPRDFFGSSRSRTFHGSLRLLLRGLGGEEGEDSKRKCLESMRIRKAVGPGGTWLRVDQDLGGAGAETAQTGKAPPTAKTYMSEVYSPQAAGNPVSLRFSTDKAGEHPVRLLQWQWKATAGAYVPQSVKESLYSATDGKLGFERLLDLQESAVNVPLDPSQFSYTGLGLKNGDLVMDRIDNICYVMKDGNPVKLASFNGVPRPPSRGVLAFVPRWGLALVGALVLLLVAVVLRRAAGKRALGKD